MIFVKLSLSLSAILFLSCVTEANQVGRQGAGVRGSSKTTAVEAVRVLAESANAFPVRVLYVLRSGPSAEKVKAPTARLHAQSEINTVPNTPTSRALHTTLSNSKSEKNKEKCTDQYCVPKWTRPRKNDAAERRLDPVDEVPVEETFVEEAVDPDEAYDYVFVGTSPDATDEVLGLPPVEEASGLLSDSQFTPGVLENEGQVIPGAVPAETLPVDGDTYMTEEIETTPDQIAFIETTMPPGVQETLLGEVDTLPEGSEPVKIPGSGYLPPTAFVEEDSSYTPGLTEPSLVSEAELASTVPPLNTEIGSRQQAAINTTEAPSFVQQDSLEDEAPPVEPAILPYVEPYATAEPLAPGEQGEGPLLSTPENFPPSTDSVATTSSAQESGNVFPPSIINTNRLPENNASPTATMLPAFLFAIAAQVLLHAM